MRLRLELFVADLDVSIAFDERVLGLRLQRREADYASLRGGDVVLGLGPIAKLPESDPGPGFTRSRLRDDRGAGVEIVLEVDDVDAALDRVRHAGHPPPNSSILQGLSSIFTPSHRSGAGPPLVCVHGFTDTWRTWELVLPALERHHDVLAVTLAGHAGGPPIEGEISDASLVDAVERAMDEAGFEVAHIVGNSLGAYVSLQLASRGRAESVVALAPAGGWMPGDDGSEETLAYFSTMQELLESAAPHAEAILASPQGRRRATQDIATNFEHIPVELLAHQMRGAASCDAVFALIDHAKREGWSLDAEKITCPARIVWGTEDKLLSWPSAAARYREDWLPHADWVELEGVGHCPQLDIPLETAQLILGFTSR